MARPAANVTSSSTAASGRGGATSGGRRTARARAAAALVAALVLALAGCGGGDEPERSSATAPGGSPAEPGGHIHGLGIDPGDGALLIATHHGLFRAPRGSTEAPRVGTSDRDLMGFTVVGPGHFLASGHPGSEAGEPANIGLAESRDGGRTWRPVSLAGEADFHVLRAAGRRVYGFDGVGGRLLVSRDLGRTWSRRRIDAPPFDLEIARGDPDHAIAATEAGLRESRDGGRSWKPVSRHVALLAWPDRRRLFRLDGQGRVLRSGDGGRTWRAVGRVDGQPVAFVGEGSDLLVGLADGTVLRSQDGGASFRLRAAL